MAEGTRGNRAGFALALVLVAGVGIVLAVLLDVGPFSEGGELTRAELVAEGDEVCADAHDAYLDLQGNPPRTPSEAADLTGELVEISEEELDEIRELDGPPEVDAQLERYLAARERGIETLREGERAAEAGNLDAYTRAQARIAASQRERQALARKVGFDECSRPLVSDDELEALAEGAGGAGP